LEKFGSGSGEIAGGKLGSRVIALVTVRHWKCDKDHTIDAARLWTYYCESGTQRARWLRIGPLIVCYIGTALAFVPAWRAGCACDCATLHEIGMSFFWTGHPRFVSVTFSSRRDVAVSLVHTLFMKDVTTWPAGALTNLRGRWSRSEGAIVPAEGKIPPNDLLREYLDIDFIARATDFVGGLIYYPFILIFALDHIALGRLRPLDLASGASNHCGFNAGVRRHSLHYLRRTPNAHASAPLKRLH